MNETVRCDRRTCQHVHRESERVWVQDPKAPKKNSTCPSCGHGVYVIVEPKDESAMTPQLIKRILAYRSELLALKSNIERELGGPRSFVRVDCDRFKGVGVFICVSDHDPTKVDVLLGNGNTWSYPAECFRRARYDEACKELRLSYLRRRGIKCEGSTFRGSLHGRLP